MDECSTLGTLRRVAGKALRSFSSTSGARRWSLRPSHIRDPMRPASADMLLRLLSEVENPVRPYVCLASIMALRKPNGSFRTMIIVEYICRLTSKVAVDLITDHGRTIPEPLQSGVKTLNGCEATVHFTRKWFSSLSRRPVQSSTFRGHVQCVQLGSPHCSPPSGSPSLLPN